jgi:hypothetical protein
MEGNSRPYREILAIYTKTLKNGEKTHFVPGNKNFRLKRGKIPLK